MTKLSGDAVAKSSLDQTPEIPGYRILGLLSDSAGTVIYRGIRDQDQRSVILKMLKPSHATPTNLSRYTNEFEVTRHLKTAYTIKTHGDPWPRSCSGP